MEADDPQWLSLKGPSKKKKGVRVLTLINATRETLFQSNTHMNDSTEGVVTK